MAETTTTQQPVEETPTCDDCKKSLAACECTCPECGEILCVCNQHPYICYCCYGGN